MHQYAVILPLLLWLWLILIIVTRFHDNEQVGLGGSGLRLATKKRLHPQLRSPFLKLVVWAHTSVLVKGQLVEIIKDLDLFRLQ